MPGSCDAKAMTRKQDLTIAEQDVLDVNELNSAIDQWREDRHSWDRGDTPAFQKRRGNA